MYGNAASHPRCRGAVVVCSIALNWAFSDSTENEESKYLVTLPKILHLNTNNTWHLFAEYRKITFGKTAEHLVTSLNTRHTAEYKIYFPINFILNIQLLS